MMRICAFAAAIAAVQSAAQQSSAECAADLPIVEASLLQSRAAFERQAANSTEDEALVEGAVRAEGEGAAEGIAVSAFGAEEQQKPAKKKAEVKEEEEAKEEDAKADAPAGATAEGEGEADKAPAEKPTIVQDVDGGATKIEPFGREDTASELQGHAAKTQDTLVDAIENAEVAEIKRSVFRALTRLRAAQIKEFDTIARLQTQAIDEYNDDHHYRGENPLKYLHSDEGEVEEDKYSSFHD